MTELIDNPKVIKTARDYKLINIFLVFLALGFVGFTKFKLWADHKSMDYQLLPEYTVYFLNSTIINISVMIFSSLIPALYLTFKKKYLMSIIVIILFLIIALILKGEMEFYKLF